MHLLDAPFFIITILANFSLYYMKIVLPNVTTHNVDLIPRFYPFDSIKLHLRNEATKEVNVLDVTYVVLNGVMTINFDFNFENKAKYEMKLIDLNETIFYRGKIFCTYQESQDFKLTKDLYFYE